jgi:uncharacterized protein YjbI with pentapeptide repeats
MDNPEEQPKKTIQTQDEWIALWRSGKDKWNAWVAENPVANVDFRKVDFRVSREKWKLSYILFEGFVFPKGNVDFHGAQFGGGNVNFSSAKFGEGNVNFAGAEFGKGNVDFSDAEFGKGNVNFSSAKFGEGDVDFSGAEFDKGNVDFVGAEFGKGKGNVDFRGARFGEGNVNFHGAQFGKGNVDFSGSQFDKGNVDFRGARFGEGNVNFHGAQFGKGNVDFRGSQFDKGNVDFRGSQFGEGNVNFSIARFDEGNVHFIGAEFGKGNVDFVGAEFGKGNVNFSGSQFDKGNVNFSSAKFGEGDVDFSGAEFGIGNINFSFANFKRSTAITFTNPTIEGSLNLSFITTSVVPDFLHADIRHHVFIDHANINYKRRFPLDPFLKIAVDPQDALRFRQLQNWSRETASHQQTLDFYAKGVRASYWHGTKWLRLLLCYFYDWFSDFGRSIIRPFVWLGAVTWGFSKLYYNLAGSSDIDIELARDFAIGHAFPIYLGAREAIANTKDVLFVHSPPATLTWLTEATIAQNIISSALIFLIGLGLRNMFRS